LYSQIEVALPLIGRATLVVRVIPSSLNRSGQNVSIELRVNKNVIVVVQAKLFSTFVEKDFQPTMTTVVNVRKETNEN
jgi:hypothetical protein